MLATPDIDICTAELTLDEVMRTVKKLMNGCAAGCDDMPPELLTCFSSTVFVFVVPACLALWACPCGLEGCIIVSHCLTVALRLRQKIHRNISTLAGSSAVSA